MYLYMEIVSIYSTYQRFNSDNGEAHLGAIVFPFHSQWQSGGDHIVFQNLAQEPRGLQI